MLNDICLLEILCLGTLDLWEDCRITQLVGWPEQGPSMSSSQPWFSSEGQLPWRQNSNSLITQML